MPTRAAQVERGEVGQGRAEAGAPDHRIGTALAAVVPPDTVGGEPGEHRLCAEKSGVAGGTDGRHGHDVAERGHSPGIAATGVEGTAAGGGDIEQGAAVDVVRQEARWAPGRPRDIGTAVQGEVGGDLGTGVAAAHHDDALPGEVGRGAVVHGVELPTAEGAAPRDGRHEGSRPTAGGADDRAGPPGAGVGFHPELVTVMAYGLDADAALDGQLVALLVVGEIVHCVPGARVGLACLRGHEAAGQRGVLGGREQVQ